MYVTIFIEWCNNNQGFMSFILSIVTIAISVIAILVSIRMAYLPYLKKVKVIPSAYCSSGKLLVDIIICNYGNAQIGISSASISDNTEFVLGIYTGKTFYVKPGKMKKCQIEITDREEYVEENISNLNNKIIISLYDVYEKKYTFKKGFPVG